MAARTQITERLHIRLNLLKLLGELVDLLHLIVDHLHRFRDVLRMQRLRKNVRDGIGDDDLCAERGRGENEGRE